MPKLYDNTRISSHRTCNRMFYWSHVRHLRGGGLTNPPLAFGSCWHAAMDIVWPAIHLTPKLSDEQVVELGYEGFKEEWFKLELPMPGDMSDEQVFRFKFRIPDTAFFMLTNYVERRRNLIESMKIVQIEKPFAVPIWPDNPDILYVGRRDKDVEWNGRIWCIEHKTTSWGSKNGISPVYLNTYSPNSQVDGYAHSLRMEYGKKAKGILVDIALVNANAHDQFSLLPIERGINNLDAWLWELKVEIARINENNEHTKVSKDTTFMAAFPKNTTACTQFMQSCKYLDLCKIIPNPCNNLQIPMGFVENKWEPFNELELSKIGVQDEK